MPVGERAAQFSPFAALTGFGAAVEESARLTWERTELGEDEREILDEKLSRIQERIGECPEVSVTYFEPDGKKSGGAYRTVFGGVKKIDHYRRLLVLTDGGGIPLDEIVGIEFVDAQ